MASSTKSSTSMRITKALIAKLEANPHKEALSTDTALLEKVLLQAKEAYYNTDKPLFSDDAICNIIFNNIFNNIFEYVSRY